MCHYDDNCCSATNSQEIMNSYNSCLNYISQNDFITKLSVEPARDSK